MRARRVVLGVIAAGVLASTSVVTVPSGAALAVVHPDATQQLVAAASALQGASMLPELVDAVPGLHTSPAQLLGLHDIFGDLASLNPANDIESQINSLGGDGVTFSNASAGGSPLAVSFDLAVDRTETVPLAIVEGDAQVLGGDIEVNIDLLPTTISFVYDDTVGTPADNFAFVDLPTLQFAITVAANGISVPLQFGFADATATGNFSLTAGIDVTLVDPDSSGRLTAAEATGSAIADIVDLGFDASPVNATLTLTATAAGAQFTGTLTLTDADIFADPAPAIDLQTAGPNPIDLLSNIGPDLATTSLAQLLSSFGGGMLAGDVRLPFLADGVFLPGNLDDGFDQVFSTVQPLFDYITPRSAGQIVCGPNLSTPAEASEDGIPAGPVKGLHDNDVVYCRAYTSVNGGAVQWGVTSGNATVINNGTSADTVGADPTRNAQFMMDADGDLDVSVVYTPAGETTPVRILPRAETIQELIAELDDAHILAPNTVTWNPDLQAFEFDIATEVANPAARSASINAGDELVGSTGISGLAGAASATASVDLGAVNAAVTFGLIATDDEATINPADNNLPGAPGPGPSDRFYLRADGPLLAVDDVDVAGTFDMIGRLGFLEITANATGSLSKPVDADPALSVSLTNPVGVTVGASSDASAILVRDLLTDPTSHISGDANLAFNGSIAVAASGAGVISASGSATVAWNLDDATPTVNVDTPFTTQLTPFDQQQTFTYTGAGTDDTLFETTGVDFLSMAGLVGSSLVDADEVTCTITAVVSATALRCNDDTGNNPITFTNGTTYDLKGNTLSHLVEILDAIERFATFLEGAVGEGSFGEPLDIVGIRPADVVSQVQSLRQMVDEFRGIQDAQLDCDATDGTDPLDIRALPIADAATQDITCHAVSPASDGSGVQWRIGDGPWTGAADDTVGPGTATVTLNVAGSLDTDGDDFVELGSEYKIAVRWTSGAGNQRAQLPPPTPGSLQQLDDAVSEVLGIPDSALGFALEDAGSDPTLRINLAYGICSDTAPAESATDCAGLPTGPTPTASLNFDLGASLPDFIGLETTGEVAVTYAALGQFDIGVPLDGGEPVLYGTTGLEARLEVAGESISFSANIGPAGFAVGTTAVGPTGTADAGSDGDTLVDAAVDFVAAGILPGASVTNTSSGNECLVSAVAANELTCAPAGGWAEGNTYRIGGVSDLNAAIAVTLDLGDAANMPVPDGDSVVISDASAILPDLGTFLSGEAECGDIDAANSDEVVADGVAGDDSAPLAGIACGRFSLGLTVGTAVAYLGEVGLDLDGDGLTVWVPNDLGTRIADAALNPAFLIHALPEILAEIEAGLRAAADSGVPDALADPLRAGADGIGGVKDAVAAGIQAFEDAVGPFTGTPEQLETFVDDQLTGLIGGPLLTSLDVVTYCGDFSTECDGPAGDTLLDITAIEANVVFGQDVTASGAVNLGLEGLPLSVTGGVEAGADWHISFGFGVSRDDGPYIRLDDSTTEVGLGASVELTGAGVDCPSFAESPLAASVDATEYSEDVCIKARLGFLSVVARDSLTNPTAISADVGLDITRDGGGEVLTMGDILGGRLDAEFTADGSVNIDLHVRTGFEEQSADMPSLLGTIQFSWDVSTADGVGDPTFAFGDLHLDLGSFIQKFIDPIAKEIRKITGPLQPIIDVITAPIPVVSDLAVMAGGDEVTMITILEAATGADLSLVEAVAAFITFVNNLPSDVAVQIPLGGFLGDDRQPGSFNVNVGAATSSVSPQDAGKLIDQNPATYKGGSGFVNDVASETGLDAPGESDGRPTTFGVPGLSFPFLDDASQLFGVLVGRDAVLVRWDAGTMRASAGLSYDFGPIMVGPVPITISIGGEIGIEGRFAIGYDTSGIRKVLAGGSGLFLFDGIFIDDLDANGVDVPEIRFFGRVFAGAKVDLVIISAGVRGGIELTFDLNLNDSPDPDGKLRIEEILTKLQNPICLFDVSGKIEAFLEAFVEIDLFFYSEEFSFELVRITLLEWSGACEPPTPVLSEPDDPAGGVLYLNVGSRSGRRNIADGEPERIEVRQLGPGYVRVSGFGWEEERRNVGLIVADLGEDDDELSFLPGQDPEFVDQTPDDPSDDEAAQVPFTIPTVVTGGSGSDIVKHGDGADFTNGDAGLASGSWAGIAFTAPAAQGGDPGDDTVNAGGGNDVTNGDGAHDTLDGQFGNDTVRGGDADDELNGGDGDDAVLGGPGGDTLQGGPIEQPDPGDTPNDDDAVVGGTGTDTVTGDFGNDVIFGDDEAAGFFSGSPGALTWAIPSVATWSGWCPGGGGEFDLLTGNDGDDWIVGGGGNDQIDAGAGADHACGSAGNDNVLGGDGDDEVRGDEDDDVVQGDAGHDIARGGSHNDDVQGGPDDDDVFGDAGSDIVKGNDGDDIVIGDDATIAGGHPHGVDTAGGALDPAAVQAMSTAVTRSAGGAGARRDNCTVVLGDSDCLFGGNGSDSMFGIGDGDFAFGETGVDFIEGNGGNDDIKGGVQDDLLFGNEGDDLIAGDSGADQAFGDRSVAGWVADDPDGTGVDIINGGPDPDRLEGDGSGDTIFGAGANDHLEGNDGDDTLHGEAGNDDVIGGSDRATEPDGGETLMTGGTGSDVMVGDNGVVAPSGIVGGRTVTLLDFVGVPIGGADTIEGDADTDYAFGGPGNDTISGDHGTNAPFLGLGAADYVEGDDGDDTINGEAGDDDLVGGGSANDGLIDADRVGDGLTDGGETAIRGGGGKDWASGDNARMNRVLLAAPDYPNDGVAGFDPIRLFDVARTGGPVVGAGTSGGDTIGGDAERDLVFGQGGDDVLRGGDGTDYLEGNDGDDTMSGGDADDDVIGGGSAADGIVDRARVGTTLHDGGETQMNGNDGVDWMAGDNALANRILFADAVTPVTLFDVNSSDVAVSGGDTMEGDGGEDFMFGQGNGAQGSQSDAPDGVDDDSDGAVDEDVPWLGDVMGGGDADDYLEGNHGADLVYGDAANDDLIGGGSAIDGVIDADRVGDGLTDARDAIFGGTHDDVVGGDNARILAAASGVLWLTDARAVVLFDVNSANAALSGGDFIAGEDGDDVAFGQGNGAQPTAAADPLDGIDDDLDGRESAASTEYDCGDGADNDGDGVVDGADAGCTAATDEDAPWTGDLVLAGAGIDYVEGNHGADWLFGEDGKDMVAGGGSAIDGVIDADRTGVGLLDGHDVINGGGDHDVAAGDNAVITPVTTGGGEVTWAPIPNASPTFDLLQRTVTMTQTPEAAGRFGSDHLTGGSGHDQLYGQQGHDWIEGLADDDAVVGDLGLIVPAVETESRQAHIAPQQPFLEDDIFAAGTLTYTTTLFSQVTGQGAEGDDIVLGGQGHDDLHGGPGNDTMNGDRYTPPDPPDPDLIEMIPGQFVFDDPAIGVLPLADEDAMFGGFGNDAMWGGRGPDHMYGGHGQDFLDVRPRPEATEDFPADPPGWFTWVALPGTQEHYQDSDVIYGGFDADALQANLADTGPSDGDRLLDWSGAFNIYYVCPPVYGDWVITRSIAPGILAYLNNLAAGDGLPQVTTAGSSGYLELGLVYTKDVKNNTHPHHPETPGHFYCGDGAP